MRESTVINEWIAEGRLETQRTALRRVLQARFRLSVPNDLAVAIQAINNSEELDRWLDIAATVDTLDAFRAALQQ